MPGQRLVWNSRRMKFVGNPDADRLLSRKYRDGWRVGKF
jgi:hypothetical protein